MKIIMVILLCISGVLAQDKSAIAKATAACGPDNVQFDVTRPETSQPSAVAERDKGLVYMIAEEKKSCAIECALTTKVGLDGSWVGAIKGNSYFSFAVTPGEHHLCVNWQSRLGSRKRSIALASFTAEPGKTYYFRTRVLEREYPGAFLDLDPINGDQGQLLVASYPVSIARAKQ